MVGRIGHLYFLRLMEAEAQRRRIEASPGNEKSDLATPLPLLVVMAMGLGAGVLALMLVMTLIG